ncbi:MAG: precorrin-8X methylmutase [Verrucomicrobiota bacterium]
MSEKEQEYGIVIAGHGSRSKQGVAQFCKMIDTLKAISPEKVITHGFLEFSLPTIDDAIRENIQAGSKKLAIVPGVLLGATHAKNDMPSEVLAMQQEIPNVPMEYGTPLNLHPFVLKACRKKLIEAESDSKETIRRDDTLLVIVGRGTTDPDANSQVYKLARVLEEGLGFGSSYVCFSGTAKPLVAEGLKRAAKMGFKRIVVQPFFLFAGVLIDRIYQAVDDVQKLAPQVEWIKSGYIGLTEEIAQAFLGRAQDSINRETIADCTLCKYRTQIVGYEQEVGTPQQGHHFEVRGLDEKEIKEQKPQIQVQPVSLEVPYEVKPYEPHPIEAESFQIIEREFDWSPYAGIKKQILQRLVHTSGDFDVVEDVFISSGAPEAALRGLEKQASLVTDVTMVQSGLRRSLVNQFGLNTFCHVHDEETYLLADQQKITRSAAGIRRAWQKYGNNQIVVIGDAPTAVVEATRLVQEHGWRPHLIIGLPVGFVGTRESKQSLRKLMRVPRITNKGTKGGSPWAATVMNAILIEFCRQQSELTQKEACIPEA